MASALSDPSSEVVSGFLHAWAAALSIRDFEALAHLFDETAVFVATGPLPLLGRAHIQAYYEQAPVGLRVQATLLCSTRPLSDLVHGIAEVAFDAPGGIALNARLGLSLVQRRSGWRVSAYQLQAHRPPDR